MIVNWSRLSSFGKCQEKAWNWDHEHLDSWQPAMPRSTSQFSWFSAKWPIALPQIQVRATTACSL